MTNVSKAPASNLTAAERWALLAVLLYFSLRVVVRTLISDTPEIDEGEQLLQSQAWQWGYGSQPPLYSWLQMLGFGGLGKTIFALALLKNFLLAAVCVLAWRTGRELAGPVAGVAALCALFFVPQFVWYSQNDLTHSVLAEVFTAALLLVVLRLLKRPTLTQFLALGGIVAGGILSKYSFGALLGVVVLVCLTFPGGRKLLADRRMLLTVALAGALLTPHLDWVWHNRDWAFSEVSSLRIGGHKHFVLIWGQGLLALVFVLASYLAPLLAAYWIGAGRLPCRRDFQELDERGQFLGRIFLGSLLAAVGAVLFFHATFNERWVQQNFYVLPLLVALILQPQLDARRLRRLGTVGLFVATMVFIVLAGRVLAAQITHAPQKQNLPLPEVAQYLKARGIQPAIILAENFNPLGGAMVMAFPHAAVLESGQMPPDTCPSGAKLVIWRDGAKPGTLAEIRETGAWIGLTNLNFAAAQKIVVPMKYCPQTSFKAAYLWLDEK